MRIPWNKGKKLSIEGRKLLSDSHKGIPNNWLGRRHSEEAKQNMSLAHKGHPAWNKGIPNSTKGIPRSEDIRRRIGEAHKGRVFSTEHKNRLRESHKGKYPSESSRLKMSKAFKGEKNHNWKGGITPENLKIRGSIEYRLWREAVFARDNFTCQECRKRGGVELNAHHIRSFAKHPELRTSIENGITLCEKCHKEKRRRK